MISSSLEEEEKKKEKKNFTGASSEKKKNRETNFPTDFLHFIKNYNNLKFKQLSNDAPPLFPIRSVNFFLSGF